MAVVASGVVPNDVRGVAAAAAATVMSGEYARARLFSRVHLKKHYSRESNSIRGRANVREIMTRMLVVGVTMPVPVLPNR